MTEKNSEHKVKIDPNLPKIDFKAFGRDDRPLLDSIIGLYNRGLFTIGLVESRPNNTRNYTVRDFKTGEKGILSTYPAVICGNGCSLDTEISQIKKQIRELENYQDLAKKALPILYVELGDRELEHKLSEKNKES